MDASGFSTMLWVFFCLLVAVQLFLDRVECGMDAGTQSPSNNCPHNCICESQMVNCTNAGFTRVPSDISPDIVSLILDGNAFNSLRPDSFRHLRRLENLSLRHCQINRVDGKVFTSLTQTLRVLWMSNNALSKRSGKFLLPARNLEFLDLSTTGRKYSFTKFKMLSKLKHLILANNFIKIFSVRKVPRSLLILDLSQNIIKTLSNDCEYENDLNLKTLRLGGNAIQKLKDDNFQHLKNLEDVDLSQNSLTEVQPLAFRSSSLKSVNLHKTTFRLDKGNWKIFQHAPHMERINISFCRIDSGNLATSAFENISNLTVLDLSGTGIISLSHMFTDLPNISKIQLSNNPITSLKRSDFEAIKDTLRELIVSSARLSTITYDCLPMSTWKKLKVVDFSDNPFLCDCAFIWMRRWLKRANASGVEVRGWDKYYCQTSRGPVSMFHLESPSDSDCFQDPFFSDPCLLTVLLLALLVWILASAASVLDRFRWHLRYWYFMKTINSAKRSYQQRGGEERDIFSFDVFVGYSRSDSSWVINQLLPRLEREYNLRVCIHERDWLAGRDIAENILESIDESRKTLLIVSNAFALSPWCHFELTMAQTRLMEEDRDSLVLILLEEIADCNLTPRLGIQMQRRTYIEWTKQSNVGRQLFWANLKHALARPSNSLMIESLSTQLFEYKEKHIG